MNLNVLILSIFLLTAPSIQSRFVEEYAVSLGIRSVILLSNNEEMSEVMKLFKNFSKKNLSLVIINNDDSHVNISKALTRSHNYPTLVVSTNKESEMAVEKQFHESPPNQKQHWMLNVKSLEEFAANFQDIDIPINSNVVITRALTNKTFEIFDVYRPHQKHTLKMTKIGSWTEDKGLNLFSIDKMELRKDLTGVYFKTSTVIEQPMVDAKNIKFDNLPPGYVLDEKVQQPVFISNSFYGDVWSYLQKTLNFSYNMVNIIPIYNFNHL